MKVKMNNLKWMHLQDGKSCLKSLFEMLQLEASSSIKMKTEAVKVSIQILGKKIYAFQWKHAFSLQYGKRNKQTKKKQTNKQKHERNCLFQLPLLPTFLLLPFAHSLFLLWSTKCTLQWCIGGVQHSQNCFHNLKLKPMKKGRVAHIVKY